MRLSCCYTWPSVLYLLLICITHLHSILRAWYTCSQNQWPIHVPKAAHVLLASTSKIKEYAVRFSPHLAHKLLPETNSFCFIISWNCFLLAARMSSKLGGTGLSEPCNSTRLKKSCLVRLFFLTSSSTTASMSFRFCSRICNAKQWHVPFITIRMMGNLSKETDCPAYLFCTFITHVDDLQCLHVEVLK